ncbi:MAG: hypothetical protein KJ905_02725 [Nanoarchaeota archaeon]|nr:hypothetical protein [Nanoarchaeota archaeon]MBU1501663.1 hypothetical protein [Nanoarchaeota archaeon]MBU2458880.1 hypothetical protein [Nanoarchaeota archaeon]
MENQEIQMLSNFEKDSEWFYDHMDELRKKGFTGKFVAVKNQKPVASDKNIDKVIGELDKQGENPSFLFIEFVHPEGYVLLL